MKCPNCLSTDELQKVPAPLPWYLWPLRGWGVDCWRCDVCLEQYYRVRVVGWVVTRIRHGVLNRDQ